MEGCNRAFPGAVPRIVLGLSSMVLILIIALFSPLSNPSFFKR